jgi:hypothetical protein
MRHLLKGAGSLKELVAKTQAIFMPDSHSATGSSIRKPEPFSVAYPAFKFGGFIHNRKGVSNFTYLRITSYHHLKSHSVNLTTISSLFIKMNSSSDSEDDLRLLDQLRGVVHKKHISPPRRRSLERLQTYWDL